MFALFASLKDVVDIKPLFDVNIHKTLFLCNDTLSKNKNGKKYLI